MGGGKVEGVGVEGVVGVWGGSCEGIRDVG